MSLCRDTVAPINHALPWKSECKTGGERNGRSPAEEGSRTATIGGFAAFLEKAAGVRMDMLDLAADQSGDFQYRDFLFGADVQDGVLGSRKICETGCDG